MRILYLGIDSDGLGIPFKLQREDNSVDVFMTYRTEAGDGILNKVESWREHLSKSDLVVAGSPFFSKYEDVFLDMGKSVIGCSKFGSMIMNTKKDEFFSLCELAHAEKQEHKVFLCGFFNGREWVKPLMLAVLTTRLMPAGLGPECGITGVVLKAAIDIPDYMRRIGKNLKKLSLKELITVGITKDGIFGVGCGIVPELVYTISEGIRGDLSDLLFGVSKGITEDSGLSEDYVVGVKLTAPPFPYRRPGLSLDVLSVGGIDDGNIKHIYPCGLFTRNGQVNDYLLAPDYGNAMFVTARGRTLKEARRRAYRTLDNIKIEGKQYRIDVGATAEEAFEVDFVKELIYGL